jgi:imidazole glycerol-phosphate synthase subunit HisH
MRIYKIAIMDFGSGNLFSITEALKYFSYDVKITNSSSEIMSSDILILPGVGSFETVMKNINKKKLNVIIEKFINTEKPVVGICLGMQILFEYSYEFKKNKGLGILKGEVLPFENKIKNQKRDKLNIGWKNINIVNPNKILTKKFNNNNFYFVHSFYVEPSNKEIISSTSSFYDFKFCSSINFSNIYAFQFHPEKSGYNGITIYKNISKLIK